MNKITKIGLAAAGILAASKLVSAQGAVQEGQANIRVVEGSFSATPNTCPATGQCTITATATWENAGDGAGTFTPAFVIDGALFPDATSLALAPGQTKTYTTTQAVAAIAEAHRVCTSPNP